MSDFILYSYFRSSASHRVRIALGLKGIAYEYRAVHLLNGGGEQKKAEYRQLNPSGHVPTLVHKGRAIGQSMAIIDYLDHVSPAIRLFPQDPYERALIVQTCEIVNSGIQPIINLSVLQELEKRYGVDQDGKNHWSQHWNGYGLEALETFLRSHAGTYAFGDRLTAADCFLEPQFTNADRYKVSLAPYPTLSKIRANYARVEAFAKAAPGVQPDTPRE